MRIHLIPAAVVVWSATALFLLAGPEPRARAADMKFEAHLLWGTDDLKPPAGKDYKSVDPEIKKKLTELPLKWKNWFEVNRKVFSVPSGGSVTVQVSEKCELTVKRLGGGKVEVVLVGKGKVAADQTQAMPKGELLMLSGPAPNATAWLVVLKRVE
jgi:hypothetical protein